MCRKRDALPEASKGLAYGIKSQSREQGLSGTDVDGEEGAVREQEQEKTRKAGQGTKTRGSVLGKTAVEVRGGACVVAWVDLSCLRLPVRWGKKETTWLGFG